MINAVVIPVALDHPLRRVEVDPGFAYQELAEGKTQTHELRDPAMKLYSNGVSKTPLNLRAMLMLWAHNSDLAGRVMVSGLGILTGNEDGADVSVPDDMLELLLHTGRFKLSVDGQLDGVAYDDLAFAYAAATYYTMPPTPGGEVRVLR